jgi:2-methylcitrate dehydratase
MERTMPHPIPRRSLLLGTAALGLCGRAHGAAAAQAAPPESHARPLAERLTAYADKLRYADIDAVTIESVKAHFIDTIGCMIAAFDEKPVRICRDVALGVGGGAATIIGTNRRTTPDLATFANGAAARYLDLNDVYVARQAGHPSDNIAACLAIAEAERASGIELVTAIVLAYEINCRLLDAFDLSTRGWDGPVFSLPAAALAAGKLMKLGPQQLTQAVNIAVNDHIPMGQTRTQTLSDWKGLADAEAARNAVFAALLARGGLTGPAPVFEGRAGFFRLVSGPVDVDVDAFGGRGVPFRINRCGMKAYPAQVYTQTAIVAAIAVAKDIGALERVAAIEIATTHRGYEMAGSEPEKWAPETRDTADHSLPYITARAMFDGEISNDSYAAEKLRDPRILAFMRKIVVKEDAAFAVLRGNAPPTRITATLDDGSRVIRQVDDMPGFTEQPMRPDDIERKFHSNVRKRWPKERIEAILEALWSLERSDDIALLLGKLSLQANL